jgi:hypothetical protein
MASSQEGKRFWGLESKLNRLWMSTLRGALFAEIEVRSDNYRKDEDINELKNYKIA